MSLRESLITTWGLVSFEMRNQNGKITYPFGKQVTGMLIYTASGHFSAQVMQSDRPLFIRGDPMKGSAQEIEANFKGVVSYFGQYTVNEQERTLFHHVEDSLFPNWKGLTLKRLARLMDHQLELSSEPTTWGGEPSIGILVWKPR